MIKAISAALALCLLPIAASAQTGAALDLSGTVEQPSQGPMIVERVHNGFLVAPDFKFTEIDHKTSGLAGGYAGFVFDDHLFVGGGGYALATERHGRDLAYGGLLVQWLAGGDETFGFGANMLLGGGRTEWSGITQFIDRGRVVSQPFRTSQGFYVAEPGLDARVRVAPHVRLALGAGYRFTGYNDRRDAFADVPGRVRLSGAVGSIALQIGGGS